MLWCIDLKEWGEQQMKKVKKDSLVWDQSMNPIKWDHDMIRVSNLFEGRSHFKLCSIYGRLKALQGIIIIIVTLVNIVNITNVSITDINI